MAKRKEQQKVEKKKVEKIEAVKEEVKKEIKKEKVEVKQEVELVEIEAIVLYYDVKLKNYIKIGERIKVTEERAKELLKANVVKKI